MVKNVICKKIKETRKITLKKAVVKRPSQARIKPIIGLPKLAQNLIYQKQKADENCH